jgi:hypothetical protein
MASRYPISSGSATPAAYLLCLWVQRSTTALTVPVGISRTTHHGTWYMELPNSLACVVGGSALSQLLVRTSIGHTWHGAAVSQRVRGTANARPAPIQDMGADHGGSDVRVSEECLHDPDVVPGFQHDEALGPVAVGVLGARAVMAACESLRSLLAPDCWGPAEMACIPASVGTGGGLRTRSQGVGGCCSPGMLTLGMSVPASTAKSYAAPFGRSRIFLKNSWGTNTQQKYECRVEIHAVIIAARSFHLSS